MANKEEGLKKQRFETLKDKHMMLWQLAYRMDEIPIIAESTKLQQAELLAQEKKKTLLKYCQYVKVATKSNWKKIKVAEAFCDYIRAHMWMVLLLLSKEAVELYMRLCRLKPEQRIRVDKGSEAPMLLVDLGLVDMAFLPEKEILILELAEDFKKIFIEVFRDVQSFGRTSPAASYLSPELRCGSFKRIIKGYEELDTRISKLIYYYGILSVEDMCEILKDCFHYTFTLEEFERYVVLRLERLEIVHTKVMPEEKTRYVTRNGIHITYACQQKERFGREVPRKPVDKQALLALDDRLAVWLYDLLLLLKSCMIEEKIGYSIALRLLNSVGGNEGWAFCRSELIDLVDDLFEGEQFMFWYQISKLYLKFPVAALGGYSREEYAQANQIKNPYKILDDPEEQFWEEEDNIFYYSYEIQWELFCCFDAFVEDVNDLTKSRLRKCSKKYLDLEFQDLLMAYGCMLAGNPMYQQYLGALAENGNLQSQVIIENLLEIMKAWQI